MYLEADRARTRQLSLETEEKPRFLITIDTEGDDQWRNTQNAPTKNSRFIPRFHELCEEFHLKPTYLTNYEMACCPEFRQLGRSVLRYKTGEVGMHLHAWNSPPIDHLTSSACQHGMLLTQCSEEKMRNKVAYMTALLEDTFGIKPRSHRAGRWAFNERYAAALAEYGYQVDCSVTPGICWETEGGYRGWGPDYRSFRSEPYWLDLSNIAGEGHSPLLEVPVTIIRHRSWRWIGLTGVRRALNHFLPERTWLRPNGRNLKDMQRVLERCIRDDRAHAQLMLHSSELMPGGSPLFESEKQIARLYEHLRLLFTQVVGSFQPATLSDFYSWWRSKSS